MSEKTRASTRNPLRVTLPLAAERVAKIGVLMALAPPTESASEPWKRTQAFYVSFWSISVYYLGFNKYLVFKTIICKTLPTPDGRQELETLL